MSSPVTPIHEDLADNIMVELKHVPAEGDTSQVPVNEKGDVVVPPSPSPSPAPFPRASSSISTLEAIGVESSGGDTSSEQLAPPSTPFCNHDDADDIVPMQNDDDDDVSSSKSCSPAPSSPSPTPYSPKSSSSSPPKSPLVVADEDVDMFADLDQLVSSSSTQKPAFDGKMPEPATAKQATLPPFDGEMPCPAGGNHSDGSSGSEDDDDDIMPTLSSGIDDGAAEDGTKQAWDKKLEEGGDDELNKLTGGKLDMKALLKRFRKQMTGMHKPPEKRAERSAAELKQDLRQRLSAARRGRSSAASIQHMEKKKYARAKEQEQKLIEAETTETLAAGGEPRLSPAEQQRLELKQAIASGELDPEAMAEGMARDLARPGANNPARMKEMFRARIGPLGPTFGNKVLSKIMSGLPNRQARKAMRGLIKSSKIDYDSDPDEIEEKDDKEEDDKKPGDAIRPNDAVGDDVAVAGNDDDIDHEDFDALLEKAKEQKRAELALEDSRRKLFEERVKAADAAASEAQVSATTRANRRKRAKKRAKKRQDKAESAASGTIIESDSTAACNGGCDGSCDENVVSVTDEIGTA